MNAPRVKDVTLYDANGKYVDFSYQKMNSYNELIYLSTYVRRRKW
jgi:hypothetical protein